MNAESIRKLIRSSEHQGTTSGLAGDKVQANLVILPRKYAFDFLLFAIRNKKAVPIIEVLEDGQYESRYAKNSDIRTDIPKYNIYRYGELIETVDEVVSYWQDDFVTFLVGCSFTFEQAIMDDGINIKHIEEKKNVAMYKTSIDAESAGVFHGQAVVSMRPFKKDDVDRVKEITGRFPDMHGGPVHVGSPGEIGISNMAQPDYGDAIDIDDDEVPVFWACGVTPQNVALNAKPDVMITHLPGHMFITDINNDEFKS